MGTGNVTARDEDPAIRLVLACCRADIGLAEPEELGPVVREVTDWEQVKALAQRHSLVPLLHAWLAARTEPGVSAEFRDWLVERFRAHTFRALALTRELLRLLPLFEAQGIPVLTFKGPVLAQQLYGQVARREFLDLDILVRESDAQAAFALLLREGYQSQFPLTAEQFRRYCAMDCELAWSHPERGVAVDLHWKLAPAPYTFAFPERAVWQGAHHVVISGQRVRTLAPELLVLFLFFHHSKHDWAWLVWLSDLAMIVRGFDADAWSRLLAEAGARRMSRMVRLGCHLLHTLFQLPLPGSLAPSMHDPRLLRLSRAAQAGLWNLDLRRSHAPLYRASMDSWVDVCRFWRIEIFQPRLPDWQTVDLPRPLHFLYVPLRLIRLVAKRRPFLRPQTAAPKES
jgi:hypothetical protein